MKTLLLLCIAIPLAAIAAEPTVSITDAGNCIVGGVNVGAPIDAIANNPALAPAIQQALAAWAVAKDADKTSALAAANAEKTAAVAAVNAAKDTAVAERDAAIATKTAALTAAQTRVAALESHLADLGTYIAALRGQLAGLGASTSAPPAPPPSAP